MHFSIKVTIGAIDKICDLVKRAPIKRDPVWCDSVWRDPANLQLCSTGLGVLAVAPHQIPCHAGFPLKPVACARLRACGLFLATDEMPMPPRQTYVSRHSQPVHPVLTSR